jgi:hypothetical protein
MCFGRARKALFSAGEEVSHNVDHQNDGQKINEDQKTDLDPLKPLGVDDLLEGLYEFVVFFYVQRAGVYVKICHYAIPFLPIAATPPWAVRRYKTILLDFLPFVNTKREIR